MWRKITLVEGDQAIVVEGIRYFPPDFTNRTYFSRQRPSHPLFLERAS